jgi:HEAT repeat protein
VPLPDLLDRLERAPDAPEAGMILQHVSTLLRRLAEEHRLEDLLSAGAALLRAEAAATTPESARRYDLALRRALTRPALRDLVPLVVMGPYRAEGFPVFRRGGADATDTLLDFLVAAPTVDERAAAFRALQAMTEGTQSIVHMLQHDAWYVLRNVAELCGVMGLAQAAPRLATLLGHGDERVRRAAAGALARLEGPDALEGTRRALHDASPVVRLEAAKAVGGARSRGLAMPIALRLEEESHADVERELLLALGRIGSPEAVQALGKAAEPGGRFRGRKSAATRIAAVEGLRLAGGQGAQRLLLALASDADREVAAAASRAVDAIAG